MYHVLFVSEKWSLGSSSSTVLSSMRVSCSSEGERRGDSSWTGLETRSVEGFRGVSSDSFGVAFKGSSESTDSRPRGLPSSSPILS
jgi:hypothetical protein